MVGIWLLLVLLLLSPVKKDVSLAKEATSSKNSAFAIMQWSMDWGECKNEERWKVEGRREKLEGGREVEVDVEYQSEYICQYIRGNRHQGNQHIASVYNITM